MRGRAAREPKHLEMDVGRAELERDGRAAERDPVPTAAMAYVQQISVHSRRRAELIKLDAQVADAIAQSGVSDGVCYVYVPHTTAGVTINEGADPAVAEDFLAALERLVPPRARYAHAEGNADSHIKASLVGASAVVPIAGGRAALGTWQSIFFCEFDGPRHRQVVVKVMPG